MKTYFISLLQGIETVKRVVIHKDPNVDRFMLLLEGLVDPIFCYALLIFTIDDVTSIPWFYLFGCAYCIVFHEHSWENMLGIVRVWRNGVS